MDRIIEKKRFTPKRIAGISAAGIFIFFVFYVFVFSDQSRKLNQEKDKITISTVIKSSFQDYIPVTGTILPIETFYLDAVDGGRVIEKYVEEGAIVKAGDPIIRLENAQMTLNTIYNQAQIVQQENNLRTYKLQLEQNRLNLQNQLLNLDLQLMNQKRIFTTNKALYEKKLISDKEYEDSKDMYDYYVKSKKLTLESYRLDSLSRNEQISQQETSVKQLQKNLKIIEEQFSNLLVRAPISGQLTALNAEIGKSISNGQNIGQIDNTDAYKVRIDIDEHYIARVHEGETGEFTFDNQTYKLIINRVYVQVNNGIFQADMHFVDETPKGIRRGQTLHIKLDLGGESDAILVETGGFYQTTGGQWIFVVDKSESYAVRRPIKIGRQNPQYYEVLEGLKPGEKVITSSYDNYVDVDKLVLK